MANRTSNEAIDFGVPIGCGHAPVFPGDIVVERVRAGESIIELNPPDRVGRYFCPPCLS